MSCAVHFKFDFRSWSIAHAIKQRKKNVQSSKFRLIVSLADGNIMPTVEFYVVFNSVQMPPKKSHSIYISIM